MGLLGHNLYITTELTLSLETFLFNVPHSQFPFKSPRSVCSGVDKGLQKQRDQRICQYSPEPSIFSV